jgi:hypothetical protein
VAAILSATSERRGALRPDEIAARICDVLDTGLSDQSQLLS